MTRQDTKYIDCAHAIIQYLLTFFSLISTGKERKRQKVIEKNENDSLFSTKKECGSLEMTQVSMWITLWKLGISLPIWGGFHKIIGKMMWKSRYTYFGSC